MSLQTIFFVSLCNDEAIGTRTLFSSALQHGYTPRLIFIDATTIDAFIEMVERDKPTIISFSIVSPYFQLYQTIYERVKEVSDAIIIVGGWQATLNPTETKRYADYVCVGEGDVALIDLIKYILRKTDTPHITNINGTPPRPLIKPSEIPDIVFKPGLTFYPSDGKLVHGDPYSNNTRYGIIAGRGCPYNCTYCSNSHMTTVYGSSWKKQRVRSVESVISELLRVKEMFPNIERINFYDEVFVRDRKWIDIFLPEYKTKINLPFYVMFYPGLCDEDLVVKLKDAGLVGVWIGVQSANQHIRETIFKRHYTNDAVIRQARLFHKYGIGVKYDFIFDNPYESEDDVETTIDFILSLPRPALLNLFSLKWFPQTEITTRALREGIITSDMVEDEIYNTEYEYEIRPNTELNRRILSLRDIVGNV